MTKAQILLLGLLQIGYKFYLRGGTKVLYMNPTKGRYFHKIGTLHKLIELGYVNGTVIPFETTMELTECGKNYIHTK
jgi:hypothetical protein